MNAPRKYVRPPQPLHFPVSALMPEGKWHFEVRTALFDALKLAFGDRACIGSDQFVYWDPTDPSACLAPDIFVRLGPKDEIFPTWKVWERGAPHVALEILSNYDRREPTWNEKLAKYRRLGVVELVRFDMEQPDAPLTVWDNLGGDLVERELEDRTRAECGVLHLTWTGIPSPRGLTVRLQDPATGEILPTEAESIQREAESKQREAESKQREAESKQREAESKQREAESKIRALEDELRRIKSPT